MKLLGIQVERGELLIKCSRKAIFQDLIEMFVIGLSNDSSVALTWKGENLHSF